VYGVILGITLIVGLCLYFLPSIIAITRGAKRRDDELARSWSLELDTWSLDPSNLRELSVEPKDQWVLR
jgi:hypothetical protein